MCNDDLPGTEEVSCCLLLFVLYIHGFMYVDTAIQFTVRDPVLQEFVKSNVRN